jgi:hypothetical protein
MTNATTDTTQAKVARTARAATSAAEETIETLRTEAPSSFVDMFDKTLARSKDMHEKVATLMESSTEAFQEAFQCAHRGSSEYREKLLDIARQNANSAFDLARASFEVRSMPELLELTMNHHRRQFELATTQMKELSALTQKVVTETTDPIRSGMTEPFRLAS